MNISLAIATLEAIREEFGEIAITGGYMSDDRPLETILVTDRDGMEVWPGGAGDRRAVGGVFLT